MIWPIWPIWPLAWLLACPRPPAPQLTPASLTPAPLTLTDLTLYGGPDPGRVRAVLDPHLPDLAACRPPGAVQIRMFVTADGAVVPDSVAVTAAPGAPDLPDPARACIADALAAIPQPAAKCCGGMMIHLLLSPAINPTDE